LRLNLSPTPLINRYVVYVLFFLRHFPS
jgi:hypothetical protein